ncbi:hypothetical protein [Streptomyces sp. NPDC059008]|uniref:hypothetical protein n=1 Tax=Streptomyces sp. NPDC059008 TaxID=3346693 RepID=UPI0036CDDB7D
MGTVDWTIMCITPATVVANGTRSNAVRGQEWPGMVLGHSCSELTKNIHLAYNGQSRPLAFASGNINDYSN